jgi:hypothetical protein
MEMGQVYNKKCTLGATDVTLPKTLLAEGLDYSGTVHELKFNYLHMRRPRILPGRVGTHYSTLHLWTYDDKKNRCIRPQYHSLEPMLTFGTSLLV